MDTSEKKNSTKRKRQIFPNFNWNILELTSNTNLFILCCIAACFSLISYLAAFSCEISWILESHGNLPTSSYLLCSGYFILFVASTILIHGLATGLSWGLFSWSVIIGCLAVPELCLVMTITTQFWGLQSTHGLTELIGYIIRLIINCLALLCIIPTALRWRREQSVLKQLQGLASRLQLQTPPPSTPKENNNTITNNTTSSLLSNSLGRRGGNRTLNSSSKRKQQRRHSSSSNNLAGGCGIDNPAYIIHESQIPFPHSYGVFGSQNEFNASIFGLDPSHYIGAYPPPNYNPNRTRSLLDLRNVVSTKYIPPPSATMKNANGNDIDENDGPSIMNNNNNKLSSSDNDPIYYTISSDKSVNKPSIMRNCVSLENLGGLTIKNDLSSTIIGGGGGDGGGGGGVGGRDDGRDIDNSLIYRNHIASMAEMMMRNHRQHQQQIHNYHHPHHQQHQLHNHHHPHHQNHHHQHQPFNNSLMFQSGFPPIYQQYPPAPMTNMQYNDYWNWSRFNGGNAGGGAGGVYGQGYGGFTNPNPYINSRSNTNSKQSLGSDDYRKYRDVAL